MERVFGQPARIGLFLLCLLLAPLSAVAAPYAALVMDARSGEVLHSRNADTRLHPASLTKMMTLYIAFEAIEHGEISLDTLVTIPAAAAAEPPSKLGLRAGQKIKLRYLIRAAAVKSANDAATAIGFAIEGSEAAFARRMNRTARAMGMTRTTFRNAHGLTQEGHMSTARDMSALGRHLIFDYPQYYNLFSRLTANAGVRTVSHTNRRFLQSYEGADGIKTGYTRAAGFNLTASARRGQERIIVTMFGGTSTAQRNARVAELMDMGFNRAPSRTRTRAPNTPVYAGHVSGGGTRVAAAAPAPAPRTDTAAAVAAALASGSAAAKTIRVSGAVTRAVRPVARPVPDAPAETVLAQAEPNEAPSASLAAIDASVINSAVAEAVEVSAPLIATAAPRSVAITPPVRPASLVAAAAPAPRAQQEVLTRISTSGSRNWGINVGRYTTRAQAERVLIKVALNEMETLDGGLRKVVSSSRGHDATFSGLSREAADLACRRLQARGTACFMVGP